MEKNIDLHEERMKVILNRGDKDMTCLLSYISGWLGNNPDFHEAFESGLLNGIYIDDNE